MYVRTPGGARRPAFVVSPAAYSVRTGSALVCPVAHEAKGYPFEVPLPEASRVREVILSDRVTSLNVRAWGMQLIWSLPERVTVAVLEKLATLIILPRE